MGAFDDAFKKKTQQKKSQKKILLQKTILKLKTNKQKYQL